MTDLREGRQPGSLICSDWGTASGILSFETTALRTAEINWANAQDSGSRAANGPWTLAWETFPNTAYWQTRAEGAAARACRARGARYVACSATFGPGHSVARSGLNRGAGLGWFYVDNEATLNYNHQARQSRTWTATCKKTIRRSR